MSFLIISGLLVSILLSLAYIFVLENYKRGWTRIKPLSIPERYPPKTTISVLIPARNETENILNCLHSVFSVNYPSQLFEVILIDDHSEDDTVTIAQKATKGKENFSLIKLSETNNDLQSHSFKKFAISKGIEKARGELIVTTDADCKVPPDWLRYISYCYEQLQSKFIAGPVLFVEEKGWLSNFQSLDFIGMMGITAGGIESRMHNMCNGANLCYTRHAFNEVNGFAGVDHLASGDDLLLMHKIAEKWPDSISFIKNAEAAVMTKPEETWKKLLSQRIRWASKTSNYREPGLIIVPGLVFLLCLTMAINIALIPLFGFWPLLFFTIMFVTKANADYVFLKLLTRHFNKAHLLRYFLPSQVIHIFYFLIVGILGLLPGKYHWKGRIVR